jgi:glutamate dehydrogenase (NADP+)
MLKTRGLSFDGQRVVVSGSGNVAINAIAKAQALGANVVACSDSAGYIVDEAGIDVALLSQVKEVERGRLKDYAAAGRASHVCGRRFRLGRRRHCGAAVRHAERARRRCCRQALVSNGLLAVAEGANMPSTRRRFGLPGGRDPVWAGQGSQRRWCGYLCAGDAAERQPRLLVLRAHGAAPHGHHGGNP